MKTLRRWKSWINWVWWRVLHLEQCGNWHHSGFVCCRAKHHRGRHENYGLHWTESIGNAYE